MRQVGELLVIGKVIKNSCRSEIEDHGRENVNKKRYVIEDVSHHSPHFWIEVQGATLTQMRQWIRTDFINRS